MAELLESYKSKLEGIAEKYLRTYIDLISNRKKLQEPKVFNDPIWHSILLYPFEVILLDSPLFQRLRRIRQLGVAHLVYPGAVHTRFEHTIGTLHQVGQLAASINASSGNCLDEKYIHLLRIAALCHDLGQGVMSHVSENALENKRECEKIKLEFIDEMNLENTKLSEVAAFYLVGSPAFREMLDSAKDVSAEYILPENVEKLVQKIIVGSTVLDQMPLLNELVSGPFDADKLDYMTRDATMSGIPVVVDIPRLVLKTRAVELPQSELPKEVGAKVREGLAKYTFIGIDLSGGRTLDELMLSRTLLFDKIYRHQKLRAAEVMVCSLILKLTELAVDNNGLLIFNLTDDELISLDDTKIKYIVGKKTKKEDIITISVISDLSDRLRQRRLFVRCIAFAETMPTDAYSSTNNQSQGLERFLRNLSDSELCMNIANDISDETEKILRLLSKNDLLADLPGNRLKPYVWISPPRHPPEGSDITRAYLIAGERSILPFREEAAETRGWADAYILTRDIGYVYAPAEFSSYVYLASEKLLRLRYNIHVPSIMMTYAKQDVAIIEEIRKSLFNKGYYDESPRDIWPIPTRLTKADVSKTIEKIVTTVSGYQGPESDIIDPTSKIQINMRPDRIKDWLRQFKDDDMVEYALRALENMRFIGRLEIRQILESFIKEQGDFKGSAICLLGSPKDSSAVVTYYATDVAETYNLKPCFIQEAIVEGKPVIMVDDFIGSGNQAVSIVENWLGCEGTTDLGEKRDRLLSESQIELLRKCKLAFIFSAGWTNGEQRLKKRCEELGLQALVHVGIHENELPTAFSVGLFNDSGQPTPFQNLCADIGRQLMSGPEDDNKKTEDRLLGYGNKANLIIFPYNTPAHTLTCIWKSGKYKGAEWVPIFPRRKKT